MALGEDDVVSFYEPTGMWGIFSNYSEHTIKLNALETYKTVEHYFQSRKFFIWNEEHAKAIADAPTPFEASKLGVGRKFKGMDPFWENYRERYMYQALTYKVIQHVTVYNALLATGQASIIFQTPSDTYWGKSRKGTGSNRIGKYWMQIRKALQQNVEISSTV